MTIKADTHKSLPVHDVTNPQLPEIYRRDGVVLVRDLLSTAEVAELRANITRYQKWILQAVPDEWVRHEKDGSIRGMYFLERVDPWFRALGERPGFQSVVERLTGARAKFSSMETFHKQPMIGSPSLVHQDGIYYLGTTLQGVNMWIAIDHATKDNAALKYWPGSHLRGLLPHGGTQGDPYYQAIRAEDLESLGPPSYAELAPGCGAFHSDQIVHGSDANHSPRQRLAFAATFLVESWQDDAHQS